MIVLGLHGGVRLHQHEPSAALLIDGRIAAVCEEERYLRVKSCYGMMPIQAIAACLDIGGITMGDVDLVVITGETYTHRRETVADLLRHHWGTAPRVEAVHHQTAHLATAFYGSGETEALCLSLDATGDGSCGFVAEASLADGIRVHRDLGDNSLGFFYTMLTYYLGFIDGDEYKVMGLAPYGEPTVDLSRVLEITGDGWRFDRSFLREDPPVQSPFEPTYGPALPALLDRANRRGGEPVDAFHKAVAASGQRSLEDALLSLLRHETAARPHLKTFCYAGGVALNCVANARVVRSGLFDRIHVPPMSSDRGLALGCAYLGAVELGDGVEPIRHAYLGHAYAADAIRAELAANGCRFAEVDDPAAAAAEAIAGGRIVGWHQGRSEAGARALGNRSILALPGGPEVRDRVNARIKFREQFRPFAPAAAAERASDLFATGGAESPYMCVTYEARTADRERLGAVVHVDGTARLQTVSTAQNPLFHRLISTVGDLTGTPAVLNTSFNLKGQPIVETPRDALMTFFGCGLDELYVGPYRVTKPG